MNKKIKKIFVLLLTVSMFLQGSFVSFAEQMDVENDTIVENNDSGVEALEEKYALENTDDSYGQIIQPEEDSEENGAVNQNEETIPKILEQPSDAVGYVGETVSFTVKAQGDDISYQWYYSYDKGEIWRKCVSYEFTDDMGNKEKYDFVGSKTNTLEMKVSKGWMFNPFKCVLTNGNGETVETKYVYIEPGKPVIVNQSEQVITYNNHDSKELFVNAKGINLRYRWYVSEDLGTTWNKTFVDGYSTSKLVFNNINYKNDNQQYRCLITDKYGNEIISSPSTLCLKKTNNDTFKITSQPVNAVGYEGEEITFSVEAQGLDLKYCWYYSLDAGKTWRRCVSYKYTDTDGTVVYKDFSGAASQEICMTVCRAWMLNPFKCVITNSNGESLETNIVHIEPGKPVITDQTKSEVIFAESNDVDLFVEAKGIYLRYRWYESFDGGNTWKKSMNDGYASNRLTLKKLTPECNGRMYYCLITDKYSNEIKSSYITLKQKKATGNFYVYNERKILDYDRVVLLNHNQLVDKATFVDNTVTFNVGEDEINKSDIIFLSFSAKSTSVCLNIRVDINNGNGVYTGLYPVQVYEEDYVLPISGINKLDTISITNISDEFINIGNFELCNLGDVDVANYVTGIMAYNKTNTLIDINEGVGFMATDSAVYGNRLYTVYQGVLTVYDITNSEEPVVIGCLSGLGDTRDIAITDGGETVVIACRFDGVNIVDVKDGTNMQVLCNIDTLGLATSVAVNGEYCFVTARRHGLDVYDISNPASPVFCDQIYEGDEEFYDCCISEGYLYVSSWAEKKVHIYSLENIFEIKKVSSISTDGNAAGCTVNNGNLFVATGYHSSGARKTKSDMNYGMGNGFEIYNVKNPSSPIWMSTSKIDGRFFISGLDHWRVVVSDNIAFVINAYNGVYVYDVSNVTAPDRIEKIVVNIPTTSNKYKKVNNANYLFPYNQDNHAQSLVTSVTPVNGKIYITTHAGDMIKTYNDYLTKKTRRGLYVLDREYAFDVNTSDCSVTGKKNNTSIKSISIGDYEGVVLPTEGNVRSATYFKDRIFVAEGVAGLYMYESNTLEATKVPEVGTATGIEVVGEYMYVSEAGFGIKAFKWSDDKLEFVCRYNYGTGGSISNIHATSDGNYLIGQRTLYEYILLDIRDKSTISLVENVNTGGMYCRNITTDSTDDGVFGVTNRNTLVFYKVGDDKTPQLIAESSNPYFTEDGGMTGYGQYVIQIAYKGYVYYKPSEVVNGTSSIKRVVISDYSVKGTPKIFGNIMVVTDSLGKKITMVEISNLDKPMIIDQVEVDGNPDEAYIGNGVIMIPLAHEGIIVMKRRE